MTLFILKLFLFWAFIVVVNSREGIHEKMYQELDTSAACFRRLNGTHQFGCSSQKSGNVGIIHVIKNNNDLNVFLANATKDDYMIALYMNMFTNKVVDQLVKLQNIGGLLLIVENDILPNYYSPDEVCPNSVMESCNDEIINPYGNSFLFIDWPFPMFMVDNENTIKAITKCFEDFNLPFGESQLSRPLCSIQMKSHMSAAVDTPTCLRRESEAGARVLKYCDPMGDRNVILPLGVPPEEVSPRSVIILAARLDSASIFDGVSPGAITTATSIVSLITVAKILSSMLKGKDVKDRQVLCMLFNGEAQDYIGSSRTVYDMTNGDFQAVTNYNVTLDKILAFIEFTQIDSSSKLFVHKTNDPVMNDFEKKLTAASSPYSIEVLPSSLNQLPPSSLQVFIKADPSISGAVLSNFDKQYTNKYYNGLLDSIRTLNYHYGDGAIPSSLQKNVASVSMSVAKVVYETVTDLSPPPIDQKEITGLVDDLLLCYLQTKLCKLMKEVSSGAEGAVINTAPWPLYVSVKPSLNPITTATGLLLAYLTSEHLNLPEDKCSVDSAHYSSYWVNGPNSTGLCLNTTLKFTSAISPAFLIPDYDWNSRKYSSWSESIWFDISVSMFLKPSRRQEWITLSVGLFVFFTSFISVYWLKSKEMFSNSPQCSLLTTNC